MQAFRNLYLLCVNLRWLRKPRPGCSGVLPNYRGKPPNCARRCYGHQWAVKLQYWEALKVWPSVLKIRVFAGLGLPLFSLLLSAGPSFYSRTSCCRFRFPFVHHSLISMHHSAFLSYIGMVALVLSMQSLVHSFPVERRATDEGLVQGHKLYVLQAQAQSPAGHACSSGQLSHLEASLKEAKDQLAADASSMLKGNPQYLKGSVAWAMMGGEHF